jgi:hypothetical protein
MATLTKHIYDSKAWLPFESRILDSHLIKNIGFSPEKSTDLSAFVCVYLRFYNFLKIAHLPKQTVDEPN